MYCMLISSNKSSNKTQQLIYFRSKHYGGHANPTSGGSREVAELPEAAAEDVGLQTDVGLAVKREQTGMQFALF
jgi:hypothetical protein